MGFVYAIICYDTGEIYVGSTEKTLRRRLQKHESDMRTGHGHCVAKQIIRRGQYDIIELEECEDHLLTEREQSYMDDYSLYNMINYQSAKGREKNYLLKQMTRCKEYSRRPEVIERNKEIIECGCGSLVKRRQQWEHNKSQKHQQWAKTQQNI